MQFLTDAECQDFFAKLGIDRDGVIPGSRGAERFKITEVSYGDSCPYADQMAKSIAVHQGNFETCLLWCESLVFGDKINEPYPPKVWREYYRWRKEMGETRDLHDAPGHLFEQSERDTLEQITAWALRMRWEAYIAAKPNKFVLHMCDDAFLTLYARSTPSGLLDDLRKLGLEPKRPWR